MKDTLKFSLTLATICFIAAASLALVNLVTYPKIIAAQQAEERASLKLVMSSAERFEEAKKGEIEYYKCYNSDNQLIGYALKVEGQGYQSVIQTMVGITPIGEITGIKIIDQAETPGLGAKIAEIKRGQARSWFQAQFQGKDATTLRLGRDASDKTLISAITGATISSVAIVDSIKKGALRFLKEIDQL